MAHAIIRGKNGRRYEVDFGDSPVRVNIEQFINYFNATMARPFRWTYAGKPLAE
jgi:hypothetical protein